MGCREVDTHDLGRRETQMSALWYLIAVLLFLALLLRLELVFYAVYSLLGIYLLSRLLVYRTLERLQVERVFTDHAFLNDEVTVTIRIRNRTLWPIPWLHVDESVPIELHAPNFVRAAYSLGSRETRTLRYTLSCRRRGYYTLGPLHLTSGDPFGFVQAHRALPERPTLIVYPAVIPLSQLGLPARLPYGQVSSFQRLFEDPNRLAGVREYRVGDSIRRVHWKASAHADTLLVKQLQPAITQEMAIVLDLDARAYSNRMRHAASEWGIVVAASLAYYLGVHKQPVALVTNGQDPLASGGRAPLLAPPRAGRGQVMHILELLARVRLQDDAIPLESFLSRTVLPLSWGVTVALVTPRTDTAIYRTLQRLTYSGYHPLLLVTEPMMNFAPVQAQARTVGAHAFHVWREQALRLLEEGRRQ